MELNAVPDDFYAGYVMEDSDLEYSDCNDAGSSDSESCSLRYQPCKDSTQPELSSDDEFERDMESEVLSVMRIMASPATPTTATPTTATTTTATKASGMQQKTGSSLSSQPEFYDEVYFDSSGSGGDGEDEGKSGGAEESEGSERITKRKKRRGETGGGNGDGSGGNGDGSGGKKKVKKLTNDELFYDPNLDEENERWIKRKRMAYHNVKVSHLLEEKNEKAKLSASKVSGPSNEKVKSSTKGDSLLPKSDATLNCPACMVTLCIDCQRHDIYVNQYRAMFVLHCQVIKDEVLKYIPRKSDKRSRKGRKQTKSEDTLNSVDRYHPVRCSECNTEVAVVDSDEVFHFFNILASAP